MRTIVDAILAAWLIILTIAIYMMPPARKDLEGKNIVINQDTLMITRSVAGDVLYLSNGTEISLKLAEKLLID
jgi:hypothetical protein